jgi:hypothetical protein
MIRLRVLMTSLVLLVCFTSGTSQTFKPVRPDKPINCEDFQAHLDHAIIDWQELKLKETRMILIARLGSGERDRKLNRTRLEYVEDYLKKHDVEYVFAEGERVQGFGRFEVYVAGKLAMSIPIKRGVAKLCLGSNGA